VHEADAWHDMKQHGVHRPVAGFQAIHMPKNTAAGVVIAAIATVFGFAMVWHMWLVAAIAFVATVAAAIVHTFNYDRDGHLAAEDVRIAENAPAFRIQLG
jgi:cytochrome o ubiquinol oxidase subunit 1